MKIARQLRRPHRGPRGGTGLSGGAIPRAGGVIIGFSRMNRILELDIENERAVLQPGVVNLDITLAVQRSDISSAPDPIQPARLHDRRQCGGELGRSPHARVWRYDESRTGSGIRHAGRLDSHDGRQGDRTAAGV